MHKKIFIVALLFSYTAAFAASGASSSLALHEIVDKFEALKGEVRRSLQYTPAELFGYVYKNPFADFRRRYRSALSKYKEDYQSYAQGATTLSGGITDNLERDLDAEERAFATSIEPVRDVMLLLEKRNKLIENRQPGEFCSVIFSQNCDMPLSIQALVTRLEKAFVVPDADPVTRAILKREYGRNRFGQEIEIKKLPGPLRRDLMNLLSVAERRQREAIAAAHYRDDVKEACRALIDASIFKQPPEGLREVLQPRLQPFTDENLRGSLIQFLRKPQMYAQRLQQASLAVGRMRFFKEKVLGAANFSTWDRALVSDLPFTHLQKVYQLVKAFVPQDEDGTIDEEGVRELLGLESENEIAFIKGLLGDAQEANLQEANPYEVAHAHGISGERLAQLREHTEAGALWKILIPSQQDDARPEHRESTLRDHVARGLSELARARRLKRDISAERVQRIRELASSSDLRLDHAGKRAGNETEKAARLAEVSDELLHDVRNELARFDATHHDRRTMVGVGIGGGVTAALAIAWATSALVHKRKQQRLAASLGLAPADLSQAMVEQIWRERVEKGELDAATVGQVQDSLKRLARIKRLRQLSGWLALLGAVGTTAVGAGRYFERPSYVDYDIRA